MAASTAVAPASASQDAQKDTPAVIPISGTQDANKPQTTSTKLEDQAALAALYVTKYDNASLSKNGYEFLDSHHKLSSAGAAASLKYASPQDLPSFPTSGLKNGSASAASAAASLGWANQKPFELWKPDPSASASAAAALAADYKMAPLWQPEQSANGAKAAILAHKDRGKVEIWKPEVTSWGNSAATRAMKKERDGGLAVNLDYGHTALGRQGSMMAATGAMATSRKRAISQPIITPTLETYPDEANATANALNAAASSFRASSKRRSEVPSEVGSTPYTTMSRAMYTSHPPVAPEVDEQNRQDTLRASAIAMAQSMYKHQQKQIDAASAANQGAIAAHRRTSSASSGDEVAPMRFNSLHDAALKLAQERLAKLHDEHAKNREYREYYSNVSTPPPAPQNQSNRLSIRGRTRRRAGSDGLYDEDREQSNKIRAQMSIFSNNIVQVDEKKRQQDREALIAAAQRNVTKSLHGMDEKVFRDTGKVAPSLLSEWEVKAHAAAQANSDTRMENYGKVHIGGGQFINQSAVDLVAARNVQPVLDEINEKAEVERERQATIKAEKEEEQRKAAEKKTREKEEKEINKKLKQQDKEERKAREAEVKAAKKENRQSQKSVAATAPAAAAEPAVEVVEGPVPTAVVAAQEPTIAERREVSSAPTPIRTSMEDQASMRMAENADAANRDEATPMSPSSPNDGNKVKNWLKTKFSRRMSKGQKSSTGAEKEKDSSFVGGAALTGASTNNSTALTGASTNLSNATQNVNAPSIKESVVGKGKGPELDREVEESDRGRVATRDDDEVSPISDVGEGPAAGLDDDEDDEFQEARDNFDEDLAPPPTFPAEKNNSPVRTAKFKEEI